MWNIKELWVNRKIALNEMQKIQNGAEFCVRVNVPSIRYSLNEIKMSTSIPFDKKHAMLALLLEKCEHLSQEICNLEKEGSAHVQSILAKSFRVSTQDPYVAMIDKLGLAASQAELVRKEVDAYILGDFNQDWIPKDSILATKLKMF